MGLPPLHEILDALTEDAVKWGLCDDNQVAPDLFDTKLMGALTPAPREVRAIFRELYSLESRRGVIPMIAHLDRYLHVQKRRDIERILEMGYPVQVSAESLSHFYLRKQALGLLEKFDGILISDCHNMSDRRPNLMDAMKLIEKKLGRAAAGKVAAMTDEILTD